MADEKDRTETERNAKLTRTEVPHYWTLGPKMRADLDEKIEKWAKLRDEGKPWRPF